MSLSDSRFGEQIIVNGVSTIANVSELKREEQFGPAGYAATYGLRIVLNKARGIVPAIGQVVTYNSNPYRIEVLESDFISYTLTCDSVNK